MTNLVFSKSFFVGLLPKLTAGSIKNSDFKSKDKHLLALEAIGGEGAKILVSLRGYRPGRPPRYGTLVLTKDNLVFCQKSKMGESILNLPLSQVSAHEITRVMKHFIIKVYMPGLEFSFSTRMPASELREFSILLQNH